MININIDILDIVFDNNGSNDKLYPAFICSGDTIILVDAGYPGMLPQLEIAVNAKGYSFSQVTQIWITHHDHDHVGALYAIKTKYPNIIICAGEKEQAYIEGRATSLRLQQAINLQSHLSKEEQCGGLAFQKYLRSIKPCNVDKVLLPGEHLLDGEIQVVDTSGHTEGHISFYAPKSKTMITGDVLVHDSGKVFLPFPQYSYNIADAKNALHKISNLPIQRLICYHGGVLEGSEDEIKKAILQAVEVK